MRNYHTHTCRCGHAAGSDREYVEKAVSEGFSVFGFSDHSPWPYEDFRSRIRMDVSELDGYIGSLSGLKREFSDSLELKIGLECEYFPEYIPWLRDIIAEKDLDYVILGNHFILDERTGIYAGSITSAKDMYDYLDASIKALETGIYTYFAHPDLVFTSVDRFDAACRDVSMRICEAAKALGVPLEYNLLGIRKRSAGMFHGLGYPCQSFWEIAKEEGTDVIVGLDAHDPDQIEMAFLQEEIGRLKAEGFHVVESL